MEPGGEPKFVVDQMLGRLATWLRVLGYDTIFSPALDDPDLARIAQAEQRVLLTRDTALARRKGLHAILIRSDRVREQLLQVVAALDLSLAGAALSRCLRCNSPLIDVDRAAVAGLVPPYVLATHTAFRRCPRCGRVYWRGTHWQRMQESIKQLRAQLSR